MKITLDATALLSRPFGIGQYALNLIHALARQEAPHHYELLYHCMRESGRNFHVPEDPRFRRRLLRLPFAAADLALGKGKIPGDALLGRPDLFHATRNLLPRFRHAKSVWTCYDVSFKVEPAWFDPETARGLDERVKSCLDRADHVIAISRHTGEDLTCLYGYPSDRVTPILLGPSEAAREVAELPGSIPRPYILFVSSLEPRKNVARLVRAFSRMNTPHYLVLAGARGWKYEDIFREIVSSPRRDRIVWLDYVAPPLLAALYRHADLFVYPSLYEGFGLPVLEAMMHGCPVVTSHVASLPEVGGDAVLYVDPQDEMDLAEKMRQVVTDQALREDLVRRGTERVAIFDWNATARATLDVYKAILNM
ncbi:MAG: glycosyltransferase family 1 protein [Candidatus Hydrogenedentota bacterium]